MVKLDVLYLFGLEVENSVSTERVRARLVKQEKRGDL